MTRLARLIGPVWIAALVAPAALGCGRPFALDGGGDAAPQETSAGSGGAASSSSGGPPGCVAGAVGACGAGNYCEKGAAMCRSCADLSRLVFHAPKAVVLGTPTTGTTAAYARTDADSGALYFTYLDRSSSIPRGRTAVAPSAPLPLAWGSWDFAPPPVNADGQSTAPLYLHDPSMLAGLVDPGALDITTPAILFDSDRAGGGLVQIFAVNVGSSLLAHVALPAGTRDARVAAAPGAVPPRFWYLSDAGVAAPRLVTVAAGASAAKPVTITLDKGCPGAAIDAPWATPDGNHLLFGAAYPDAACDPTTSAPAHLFHARLDDEGQQLASTPAQRIFPDDDAVRDGMPSLSADLCFLLFSRFDADADGALYAAVRE
jgi:hypothetical protein